MVAIRPRASIMIANSVSHKLGAWFDMAALCGDGSAIVTYQIEGFAIHSRRVQFMALVDGVEAIGFSILSNVFSDELARLSKVEKVAVFLIVIIRRWFSLLAGLLNFFLNRFVYWSPRLVVIQSPFRKSCKDWAYCTKYPTVVSRLSTHQQGFMLRIPTLILSTNQFNVPYMQLLCHGYPLTNMLWCCAYRH